MTEPSKYNSSLANLTRNEPVQLDPALFGKDQTKAKDIPVVEIGPTVSGQLWARHDDSATHIGVRVSGSIDNKHSIAADFAAVAIERQIVPIFLSRIGQCGMEKFGFRVELIVGDTEDQMLACEEQLKRLWDIAIVVDAAEVAAFG